MAESPQFETLVQSLSSTLQSLEQKRKRTKNMTFHRNMGRRDYSRDWYCIFPLCQCSTYWNRHCGRSCFIGILQLYKCQIAELIHLL